MGTEGICRQMVYTWIKSFLEMGVFAQFLLLLQIIVSLFHIGSSGLLLAACF